MNRQAGNTIQMHSRKSQEKKLDPEAPPVVPSSMFHSILLSEGLPPEEKRRERIAQDGFVVMVAGGETTARVLTAATYHLLTNKDTILARLQKEVGAIDVDSNTRPDLKTLERLPWLVWMLTFWVQQLLIVFCRVQWSKSPFA